MTWVSAVDGARAGRVALVLFVLLASIYLATATYDAAQITDTRASAVTAWSLGEGEGFTLPAEWEDVPWRRVSVDGEVVTNRFPGASVLAAPFYTIWPDSSQPQRSFDVPYAPAGVASAVLTAAAMAVLFLVLDELVSRRAALVTALLVALGTATWSVSADSLYTHGPGQLALALALLAVGRGRWAWAGLAFGAAVVVRPQLAVIAAVVGVGLAISRRSLRPMVGIGVTSALGVAALAFYTHHFFGSWVPIAGYSTDTVAGVVGAVDPSTGGAWISRVLTILRHWVLVLFDPRRGIFLYSPFLLVLLVLLVVRRRSRPPVADWVWVATIAGIVLMTVQLAANPAWFGGADFFAYRLPLEMITLAAPLLAGVTERVLNDGGAPRLALAATACASVVIFALGSTVLDPREEEREDFFEMVEELGPRGEGYESGTVIDPPAPSAVDPQSPSQ